MAKKQKTQEVEVPTVKAPVVETKKPTRKEPTYKTIDGWELKDRMYRLTGNKQPLSHWFKSRGLYYFDEKLGYEREIMYSENQKTVFVDEMQGQVVRGRIIFRNGILAVPKNKVTLQKMLSIYHPQAGKSWEEVSKTKEAKEDLEDINVEIDALIAAREMDIDMAEAIMRVEVGSNVVKMSSKELKRDLLLFAKNNPDMFLELANDDNVHLRNIGIKAVEMNIIKLSSDQRTFSWASNDRKLMNVPFDEHPYTALAHWFKTDEGMEIFLSIEKRLK